MTDFMKAIKTTDKILDCVPVVSTVKNAGILIYQTAYKVDSAANPVKNSSWKDDIKIYALSKNKIVAGVSMIPILGNLAAFGCYLTVALKNLLFKPPPGSSGCLKESAKASSWGLKNHSYEVVALYLARNPNCSEEKLRWPLIEAAKTGKSDIINLILTSRKDQNKPLSEDLIEEVLLNLKDEKTIQSVLQKNEELISEDKTKKILGEIEKSGIVKENQTNLIKFLIEKYPTVDIGNKICSLFEKVTSTENPIEIVCFLLEKIPEVKSDKMLRSSLSSLLIKSTEENIEDLLKNHPILSSKENIDTLISYSFYWSNKKVAYWLLENSQKENISSRSIVHILIHAARSVSEQDELKEKSQNIINFILKNYSDISGKDLEPAIIHGARYDTELLKICMENFKLDKENLQRAFNDMTILGSTDGIRERIQLVKQEFPDIKFDIELTKNSPNFFYLW